MQNNQDKSGNPDSVLSILVIIKNEKTHIGFPSFIT